MYLVPDVCVLEVATAVRRHLTGTGAGPSEAASVLADFRALDPVVFGSLDLVEESLTLGSEVSVQSGVYVVLALTWGVPLCTLDKAQAEAARKAGAWLLEPGTTSARNWPPMELNA